MTLAPGPLPLDADPTRLVQVFANLVNNAAKYTDSGGHIASPSTVENGEAVVRVRDDGMGMTPGAPGARLRSVRAGDPLPRPRAGRAGNRPDHGPDPGQDARRIGASVQRRAGSRQRVRREAAARAARPGAGGREAGRGRERCEPSAARAGGRRQRGRRVDPRTSARAARTPGDPRPRRPGRARGGCRAAPPELVLLDIGLPGMDGYAVAARLREAGHDRAALVALTGYGQDEHLRRSAEAGFDHHLVKPVDLAVLRKITAELRGDGGAD